ncbi:Shikimate kinase [Alteracholeplasma palmae J233]|uniref:Shikimate kinase n=1 Tax=Alteracholeplasma palmae (strain ATCC 49389 / J233) TaxID=1318466 RepID=U4KKL4_ALTPJ|nr:shikimate kinase [Alteracholeplasma palmae]CCV64299.1 Shikimate kinase [Alteracholeplasma palmae J233]
MRIYIIGMPGSGKSTVSKQLAEKISYELYDLDSEIEKNSHMFIDQIFSEYGEETFRNLETKELEKTVELKNVVVSCGGGIVTQKRNKRTTQTGLTIYIDTNIDIIKKRLEKDTTRPLLKSNNLENLYEKRFLKYQNFADWIVSNDKDSSQTVEKIVEYLKGKNII